MEIEKNIPIPDHQAGCRKGITKYPFQKMEVGDSVLIKWARPMAVHQAIIRTSPDGWKFTCRSDGKGYRVWRIK